MSEQGLVISQMQAGLDIVANFDELEERVNKMVELYQGAVIAKEDVPTAKKERAWLNSQAKEIDAVRLRVKKEYMKPVDVLEANVKRILAPIKEASAAIDAQIKAFEEQERIEKRAELDKHYAEYAGVLVDAVPYSRIHKDEWLNKSFNLMAAFEAIEETVNRIARDEAAITALDLPHETEAKAEYFATLDMSRAIERSREIECQLEAARAIEVQKQEYLAEQAVADQAAEQEVPDDAGREGFNLEPVSEPVPAEDREVEISTWTFTLQCSRTELDRLISAAKRLGLHGTVKRAGGTS